MWVLQLILLLVGLWLISGTLINFSKHPHWYVRGWDFPRVIVAFFAAAVVGVYAIWWHEQWWDWLLLAGLVFVVARQLYLIFPYTPIAPERVKQSTRPRGEGSFRLVISNVLRENTEREKWLDVIRGPDPDVIVAVEVDRAWDELIESSFGKSHPHRIRRPQDDYYGMVVYSRLPFEGEPEVRFVVQDDVPSIHLTLKLPDGCPVRLHAMHPRPPEPLRNQDSAPRDAELVIVGKEIAEKEREIPVVVCGDLNDVAWSYTTQLFLRISRLLDPRMGRGQYASFNAKSRLFRFPLDHVFHSNEFKLLGLRVLPYAGSDHFPMLIELSCEPEHARREQPEPKQKANDHKEAGEIIDKQAEREVKGEEKGHVSTRGSG